MFEVEDLQKGWIKKDDQYQHQFNFNMISLTLPLVFNTIGLTDRPKLTTNQLTANIRVRVRWLSVVVDPSSLTSEKDLINKAF